MPNYYIFSDNNSGSREHLWPQWIHDRKDCGPIKMKRANREIVIPDPKITVKAVCKKCNNGWMSNLEGANIPLAGAMMQDISVRLDRGQQKTVCQWLTKMAFLVEWTRDDGRRK